MSVQPHFLCYYPDCAKTFVTKFNLRRHVNSTHLAIKAYTCPVCLKRFACKQNLSEHNFIHTGEKPFGCPQPGCGKRFRQASQLCVHRKTHKMEVEMCRSYDFELKLTHLLAHLHEVLCPHVEGPLVALPPLGQSRPGKLPVLPQLLTQ